MSSLFHIIKRTLFIKNTNLKTCIKCIYFIDEKYGKCKMFGKQNVITVIVWCRQDNSKCGQGGNILKTRLII
jgi:hypothetical protein